MVIIRASRARTEEDMRKKGGRTYEPRRRAFALSIPLSATVIKAFCLKFLDAGRNVLRGWGLRLAEPDHGGMMV